MKEIKLFEVRDRHTRIAAIAVHLVYENSDSAEDYLMRVAGYCGEYILFGRLDDGKLTYDGFSWGDRIMQTAHNYIIQNWNTIESGDVVDVEHILGETTTPKISDILC